MQWAPHPVFEGYSASRDGMVKTRSGYVTKGYLSHQGYYMLEIFQTDLMGSAKRLVRTGVHRIVYACFHGCITRSDHIHHRDGCPSNNSLDNLQKVTAREHRLLTLAANPDATPKQAATLSCAVTRTLVLTSGEHETQTFTSMAIAAGNTPGARWQNISACCSGVQQTHAGYTWTKVTPADLPGERWATLLLGPRKGLVVSSCGRVKQRTGLITSGRTSGAYLQTSYRQVTYWVHRLICEAFHGSPAHNRMTVDHINHDTRDNRAENLRWATYAENHANKRSCVR